MDSLARPRVAAFTTQARLTCRRHSARRLRAPAVALFGPSKEELELKSKLDSATRSLEEAIRRAADLSLALQDEKAARKKVEDERDLYQARLKEAEKDVFKLERRVEETDKKLASYQVTAERQIALLADALKKAGIQL